MESLDVISDKIGGKKTFMEACRLIPEDNVLAVVAKWDHMGVVEKRHSSLHQLFAMEGVNPVKLVGWIASALYVYNVNIAKMINAVKQPEVMEASVDSALLIGKEGFNDREMQLKISGLLKEEKGPLVNINLGHGGMESQEEFLKDVIDV